MSRSHPPLARRLRSLPRRCAAGRRVPVATTRRARLLGLALLSRQRAGEGLLIPRCASVHTFGMRFRVDVLFLDAAGRVLERRPAVPPRRLLWCRGAAAVLELPAGQGGEPRPARPLARRCFRNDTRSPASSSARTTR